MKKSRMRIVLWGLAIVFMLILALWEINKVTEPNKSPALQETQEVVDDESMQYDEAEPEDTMLVEEAQEPLRLLIPEFVAESMSSGQRAGILSIPAIGFQMEVISDATAANLNRAPALMKSTQFPGDQGNAVISGHRMYEYGSHFNRIDELKIGDEIQFEIEDKQFSFTVEQIMVVDPSEIWITLGDQRETRLTLFACTPIRIATHRIVVFAVLNTHDQ